jgi:hypothetical protein
VGGRSDGGGEEVRLLRHAAAVLSGSDPGGDGLEECCAKLLTADRLWTWAYVCVRRRQSVPLTAAFLAASLGPGSVPRMGMWN